MKKVLLLSLLLSTANTFGQLSPVESYKKRLNLTLEFKKNVDGYLEKNSTLYKEIENYKNKKLIKSDYVILNSLKASLGVHKKEINNNAASLLASNTAKLIDKLDSHYQQRDAFLKNKTKLEEIEKRNDHSKQMKQYLKAIKEKKYTKAQVLKLILKASEKTLADEYYDMSLYHLRNKPGQAYLLKEIETQKSEIERKLSYPERAMEKITDAHLANDKLAKEFQDLKITLSKPQIDIEINPWHSGQFSCSDASEPKFQRFKNFPNYILLLNRDSVLSVLHIDENSPTTPNYIYECKDLSQFGGCLENTKKKLCELDLECKESLSLMEDSFKKDEFFNALQENFIDDLYNKRLLSFRNGEALDILADFERDGGLGGVDIEELREIFRNMITISKSLKNRSPESLINEMKKRVEKSRKDSFRRFPKNAKSERALDFLHNTMNSFFSQLTNEDKLQEFSYTQCHSHPEISENFCHNYTEWNKKYFVFEEREEVTNLVEDECPRLVLRPYEQSSTDNFFNKNSCKIDSLKNEDMQRLDDLEDSTKHILNKL